MTKGKNFSLNNPQKRCKNDFYQTPHCLTRLLLEKERLVGTVLEPACGKNAIVDVLPYCTAFYDIEKNFFTETGKYDTIVTNPPFSLAYEFIQKAKDVANEKIIMLLPLAYLHGKKRFDNIWQDTLFPLKKVYVFTRYPLLEETLQKDGKHKTGMMVYAWFVWDKRHKGLATIEWLDNDSYTVNSKKIEESKQGVLF